MSAYSATQYECLYSQAKTASQLNTFTTEDNLQKTYPAVAIPGGYFTGGGSKSRSLRIRAMGRLGTTGSPTFLWTARLLTSETWSNGGVSLGATAALTAGTAVTLAPWFLDMDVVLNTESIGGASTVVSMGEVRGPLALASPFAGTIPNNNVTPAIATVDAQTTYFLFLSVTCGTNNAANLIQLESLQVYGEN